MGLSDRDYMHERRPKEKMWERSQQVSTLQSNLWMILTWALDNALSALSRLAKKHDTL